MKITLGYPSAGDESQILSRFQLSNPLDNIKPVADSSEILAINEEVKKVYVDPSLNSYIVDIVNKTRKHQDVILGSSPRGSLSLYRAAQAWALYNERDFVLPDDIKKMVLPVLSHRIMLKQEAKLKKISSEDIINSIMGSINVPVKE
jgi:MoxR-like ATPase